MSKFDPRTRKPAEFCGVTRKRRFKSEGAGLRFIAELGENCAAPMRVYQCQRCGGWHLTSKTREIAQRSAIRGKLAATEESPCF